MLDEQRWNRLIERLCGNPPPPDAFGRLVAAYREPHRRYHTMAHIEHCLHEFDAARDLARNPDRVEFAIWLHDSVYDPQRTDNEEKSALWAVEILTASRVPRETIEHIRALILSTQHEDIPSDPDARLLVDIDVSGFGLPWEEFDLNGRAIREEYAWVDEEAYRAGRVKVLRGFFERPRLYLTDRFESAYGARGRANLRKALERLEGAAGSR